MSRFIHSDSGRITPKFIGISLCALALTACLFQLLTLMEEKPPVQMAHAEEITPIGDKPGKIYSYQDSEGRTHYVDRLDAIPEGSKNAAKERKDLPEITRVPGRKIQPLPSTGGGVARVELLVAEWCGYCRKLEAFLQDQGIRYKKYDIERSSRGRSLYARYGKGGVPVTLVDDKAIQGYNPSAIIAEIRRKRANPNLT